MRLAGSEPRYRYENTTLLTKAWSLIYPCIPARMQAGVWTNTQKR